MKPKYEQSIVQNNKNRKQGPHKAKIEETILHAKVRQKAQQQIKYLQKIQQPIKTSSKKQQIMITKVQQQQKKIDQERNNQLIFGDELFLNKINSRQPQTIKEIKLLKQSPKEIANSLVNNVAQNICQEIQKNYIILASQPTNLGKIVKKHQENQVSKQDIKKQEYQILIKKKQKAKQQLIRLQSQQQYLKRHNSNLVIRHEKKKYQISQTQKERWRKFRILQRQHHVEFSKKQKIYQEQSKKYRQEQLKLQQQRNQQKSQQKRTKLSLKIAQIQQRHDQRTASHQEQTKIIQRLKSKKKLFEKMEENFIANNQRQENQHYQKFMNQYKNRRNVDMNQIKNHQKSHLEMFKQKQIIRQRRMSQLIDKTPSMFHSRFLKNVLQQDQNKRHIGIQKFNNLKDLYDRKIDYGKIVKQNFKPQTKLQAPLQQKQMKSSRSMSAFDIQQKGNQYMKKVNESLTNLRQKIDNKQPKKQIIQEPFRYKNYLKQIRMRQTSNSNKNDQSKQMQMIKNIMNKQNMTQQEKFYQARVVAQRIQGKGPQRILDSINAKIQILKKLGS